MQRCGEVNQRYRPLSTVCSFAFTRLLTDPFFFSLAPSSLAFVFPRSMMEKEYEQKEGCGQLSLFLVKHIFKGVGMKHLRDAATHKAT